MTRNDTRIIHTDGLEEGIRCAMCTNPMANNRGCDGGCDINESMYKRVLDVIKKNILEQEPKTDTWSIKDVANTLAKHGLIAEQEPCEGAVSRQAVCNIVDAIRDCISVEGYWAILERLKKLPSVNPQKIGWIPVSERLPEDNELVLFSTKTDRVFEGRFFSDNTDRQWYSFRDETFAWNNVVIAWMPLPEPYKEESKTEKALAYADQDTLMSAT